MYSTHFAAAQSVSALNGVYKIRLDQEDFISVTILGTVVPTGAQAAASVAPSAAGAALSALAAGTSAAVGTMAAGTSAGEVVDHQAAAHALFGQEAGGLMEGIHATAQGSELLFVIC